MSTYESDPAGLGVGKRYGPLAVGGVAGELPSSGSQKELVFELAAGEIFASGLTLDLPANYLIEALYLEVETAFDSGTPDADIVVSGGAGLTTDFVLGSAAAMASVALTGMTLLSGTAATTITLTPDADAIASVTGAARVIVQYKSV